MAVLPPQGISSRILVQSPSTINSKHTTCFYVTFLLDLLWLLWVLVAHEVQAAPENDQLG